MRASPLSAMTTNTARHHFVIVYDGANRALGFIMARRKEFEAWDVDEVSLGLFRSQREAAEAIQKGNGHV